MTAEEIVRYVVSRAVWAPSVHNTQPWRFAADGGPRISLHADVERRLPVADPDGREMMISCGAALFTIRLQDGAGLAEARVHHGPFYDPDGERLRA